MSTQWDSRRTSGLPSAAAPSLTRARERGLGLVEMLVALTISAVLLTATAITIDAAMKSYSVNLAQADTMQRARVAMHRICTHIRTAAEHQPLNPALISGFVSGQTVTDTGIMLLDPSNNELSFRFDQATGRIIANEGGTDRVLLNHVQTFTIKLQPMRSEASVRSGGGHDRLARATLLLSLRPDNLGDLGSHESLQPTTLSMSVIPRRNVW